MQILHISDTHLGARKYNLDSREKDIYETFSQLIDIAIREHVNAIIHTGDLFDTYHPPPQAFKVAIDNLKKINDKGIPFISIPGDHDTPKRRSSIYPQRIFADSLNYIKLLTTRNTEHYDLSIDGKTLQIFGIEHIPTLSRDTLLNTLQQLKPKGDRNILMLHQGLRNILPYDGAWQLEVGDLPKGFDYYAFGHFHTRKIEKLGTGVLSIAGSPDIIRDEEIEGYKKSKKGAFLVDLSKKDVEIHNIDTDIRVQDFVTINTDTVDQDINAIINKYKNCKKKPILHIILEGSSVSKTLIFKKLSKLEEYTEFYRIAKDNTISNKEEKITLPSSNTISEIISAFLRSRNYNDDEINKILEIINNYDSDNVYLLIKNFAGVNDED
ncbi:exonuclease SbcCD subunit D [Acidianus sulfidivorans JP7]|uniref:DNA double-strand break repair protein Mre11 n=1 Tax=Acidianus sulfidivorans JP7 TaxID=619593 RepID=A0A2U9IQ69_9CREN|nr:DNA double-strand break repair protein Mre11 [Acidianus sulfidivorans]AWR98199.1 exonuclease SbcCD subunit D [Acidianus sulfidivorans JP7]